MLLIYILFLGKTRTAYWIRCDFWVVCRANAPCYSCLVEWSLGIM